MVHARFGCKAGVSVHLELTGLGPRTLEAEMQTVRFHVLGLGFRVLLLNGSCELVVDKEHMPR